MNESVKNKMRNRCNWIANVTTFSYYLGIIALIIMILSGMFTLFKKPDKFTIDFKNGNSVAHSTTFHYDQDTTFSFPVNSLNQDSISHAKTIFLLVYSVSVICMILTIFIIWKLRIIFGCLDNEQTPFTIKNCKALSHISYTLILIGLFSEMLPDILLTIFGFSTQFQIDFNLNALFLGCMVLALSYFFEYGVVLQQESDELL